MERTARNESCALTSKTEYGLSASITRDARTNADFGVIFRPKILGSAANENIRAALTMDARRPHATAYTQMNTPAKANLHAVVSLKGAIRVMTAKAT